MRSPLADWLDKMQQVADTENITVAARHFDVLDYYFKMKYTPEEAFDEYKKYHERWTAITLNGKHTEVI